METSKKENSQEKLQIMTQKQFLSLKEACLYLDVSKSFLYKLTSKNEIDFNKPKGKIYFNKTVLNNWMSQNPYEKVSAREEETMKYLEENGK